jgi:hypothetical protein
MENKRDDLEVIIAGYTKEIEELFNANPGFKSRIAERFIFEDYNAAELTQLFQLQIKTMKFVLSEDSLETASTLIKEAKEGNKVEGNGRWIRNFVGKIKKAQANRIINENSNDLYLITKDDIINGFKKM